MDSFIHNLAGIQSQPFADTSPEVFESLWRSLCLGAVRPRVLPPMLKAGCGNVLFVGATASVKAGADFSAFGSAKFVLRGLAQSMARELGPAGIHVSYLIIDGVIWDPKASSWGAEQSQCLQPQAIARTCLHLLQQESSAWTHGWTSDRTWRASESALPLQSQGSKPKPSTA